jgi:hypothetical protein
MLAAVAVVPAERSLLACGLHAGMVTPGMAAVSHMMTTHPTLLQLHFIQSPSSLPTHLCLQDQLRHRDVANQGCDVECVGASCTSDWAVLHT